MGVFRSGAPRVKELEDQLLLSKCVSNGGIRIDYIVLLGSSS